MKVIVFDCETTGLLGNTIVRETQLPEIVECYACLVDLLNDDPPLAEVDFYAKPKRPMPTELEEKTKITNKMLEDKLPFAKNARRIRDFLQNGPAVVAHNCSFDTEMLEIELRRCNLDIVWPRKICTVEQTVHLQGKRLSLGALHEHLFGHKFKDAHRAKIDVQALVRCCRELYHIGELL
jgi:DNA polymerase III epsilon subunit-like protein